jgi:hypothetical protein
LLLLGLPFSHQHAIRGGAICLLAGVLCAAAYARYLMRQARAV